MSDIDKLKTLLVDFEAGGVANYEHFENTIVSLMEASFDSPNDFIKRAHDVKSGWGIKSAIAKMYGQASDSTYRNDKYEAYLSLIKETIDYLEKYEVVRGVKQLDNKKIFIVHGHDDRLKFEMSDWLRSIDLDPIILHLRANMGITTIIEKIEQNADVGCAIILMTADDLGKKKDAVDLNLRARQNVVFEAGYFIGKLGRQRVIMLFDEGIEAPGDLSGCIYIEADKSSAWKEDIRREFNEIGIDYKR